MDARGIARVHVDAWRDTYADVLPRDYLVNRLGVPRMASQWARCLSRQGRGEQTVVVTDGRRVVGFASSGASREPHFPHDGEIYAIYVDIDYQGLGLGRRLCAAAARHALELGRPAICVEVLERNPSRFFYEAMGARPVVSKHHPFAGLTLPALIYRWAEIDALAAADVRRTSRP